MRFYSIIWKIIICIGILFGIIVLFNDKQSLSLFRTIVFGFIPILISLVFFLLRKNKIIVLFVANSFLIVLLILSIFEVYPFSDQIGECIFVGEPDKLIKKFKIYKEQYDRE